MAIEMNAIDDIRRRLRISNLQARMELCEIDCAALTREIDSPLTAPARKEEAMDKREAREADGGRIRRELESFLNSSGT